MSTDQAPRGPAIHEPGPSWTDAAGRFLHAMLSPPDREGPPYVHVLVPGMEDEPARRKRQQRENARDFRRAVRAARGRR